MDEMMLDRREFVERLMIERKDLLVVSGLGSATYDMAACSDGPLNFYLWGAMGGTAMIGLGLAIARPDRRIAVITGDGDMLMGMGSLATIGVKKPGNLSVVVLDNRHYGETGMQASHTGAGIDLVDVALACRFKQAYAVSKIEQTDEVRPLLHSGEGPIFISVQIKNEESPRVLPTRDGHAIKRRFIEALNPPSPLAGEGGSERSEEPGEG